MLSKYFYLFTFAAILIPASALLIKPQIAFQEDMIGHLTKARQQPLTRYLQGWNFNHWSGYNEDSYPNGYHYFLKLFLTQFDDDTSVQLSTTAIIIFQLNALLYAAKTWFSHPNSAKFAFITSLIMLIATKSKYLGNFQSLLLTGAGPAGLGFVFFLLAVASVKKSLNHPAHIATNGLLIGLSLLTHTLTALAVILLFAAKFFASPNKRLRIFESLLIGSLIGLPWIWITLNPDFAGSRINFSGEPLSFLIPLGCTVLLLSYSKLPRRILIPAVILMAASFTPTTISDWLQQHNFGGIHFYRFFIYSNILGIFTLTHLLPPRRLTLPVLYILLLTFTGTALQQLNQIQLSRIDANPTLISHIVPQAGRVMDVSANLRNFAFSSTPTYLFTQNTPLIAADGLFFESSPIGIFAYSLEYTVSPQGFMLGIDNRLLKKSLGESKYPLNAPNAARVLGINYIIQADQFLSPSQEATIAGSITHFLTPTLSLSLPLFLSPLDKHPLVEPLAYLPQYSSQTLTSWWSQATISNLFRIPTTTVTDAAFDALVSNPLPTPHPPANNLTISKHQISYQVDSSTYIPMFVKFNYNPYFVATTNGQPVPIAKISPHYMLVPSLGTTTITWKFPTALTICEIISISTLGLCLTIAAITIIRNSRFKQLNFQLFRQTR